MVIVRIWEGLGNQLFQYAFARALSLSAGQKVFLDIRETGRCSGEQDKVQRECGLLNFKISLPICTNVPHFYPYVNGGRSIKEAAKLASEYRWMPYKYFEESELGYHEELLSLKGNWYLQGWFQSGRYFGKYRDILIEEIRPRKKIHISQTLQKYLKGENTVSVHIRRGDYIRVHNSVTTIYYANAIRHIEKFVKNPFWIIFSDDPEWVQREMNFGKNCYYVSGNESLKDYEELCLMSCCKNNIIANSTFSWWGAWLNRNPNKIVIAPEKWFLKGIRGCGQSIILPEWIRKPIE